MRKPGAKALVIYDKKLLLILRDNIPTIPFPNTWNLPGGGIEENETAEEAIKMELLEEICVIPENLIYFGKQLFDDGSIVERFLSKLTPDEYKRVKLGDEGQRLDYFSVDEAAKLEMSDHSKGYFYKYHDLLKQVIENGGDLTPEALGLIKD